MNTRIQESELAMEHLPKVELHCHLIGVIDPPLLRQLEAWDFPLLVSAEDLESVAKIQGLAGFAAWLEVMKPYQRAGWRDYLPIMEHHMSKLISHEVTYAELTISPLMFPGDEAGCVAEFTAFREQVDRFERGRLQMEFLLIVPKTLPVDRIPADERRALRLHQEGLVAGVAVAGRLEDGALGKLRPMLRRLKEDGLGIEIHAGEEGGADEVREALEGGLADRIGHGIAAFRDPATLELLGESGVHLEFCLSSNLATGVVADLKDHPFRHAWEAKLPLSLNTDDPGMFQCSPNGEFALAAKTFGVGRSDFQKIYRDSLNARFQSRLRHPHNPPCPPQP